MSLEARVAALEAELKQYRADDAIRWEAVHARITTVTMMIGALVDGMVSHGNIAEARTIMATFRAYQAMAKDAQDPHPACLTEFERLLNSLEWLFRPAAVPTPDSNG